MVKSLAFVCCLFLPLLSVAADFTKQKILPLLHIQPAIYALGDVKEGAEAVATFLIRNNSAHAITLVDIQAACGCTSAKPDSYWIPAYGFTQLKVVVDTTAKQEHIKKTVYIKDDKGHEAEASLTFSVIDNPHFIAKGKPKGIFDGQCASCHYEPVLKLSQGKAIYDAACVMCHGVDGKGAYAPKLTGYASLSALKHTVAHGVGKPQMPAFAKKLGGPLRDKQIEAVTTWLMSLPEE